MLKKRILPCLDIKNGRTVKGTAFVELRDAGDPVELARRYAEDGADELVFLDITATIEGRLAFARLVESVALAIDIPFTVGGGISSVENAGAMLKAGADKVSVNSAAVSNPGLLTELRDRFGSQCVTLAIDADLVDGEWRVFTHGGRTPTSLHPLDWALEGERLGAGEILLTVMPQDGAQNGYDIELTNAISSAVGIPLIASGGAGRMEDFVTVFQQTQATAALAASTFHYGKIAIAELKLFLNSENIPVRCN